MDINTKKKNDENGNPNLQRSLWPQVDRHANLPRTPRQKLPAPQPGAYVPPHLRSARSPTSFLTVPCSTTLQPSSTRSTGKHDPLGGPLRPHAVELFKRYHGLDGKEKVSFVDLVEECAEKYHVKEKAVLALVLGTSYDDLLADLRGQVPSYPATAIRRKSKSCGSSPTNLNTNRLSYQKRAAVDAFDLATTKVDKLQPRNVSCGSSTNLNTEQRCKQERVVDAFDMASALDTSKVDKLQPRNLFLEFDDLSAAGFSVLID